MKLKNNAPLTARIKKLMQSDDDVGKVAKASPVLIAKALDIFLHNLVQGSVDVAEARGARTLTCAHVKAHVNSEPLLDFLKDTVAPAPDLPPPGAEEAVSPKPKRQRVVSEEGEGGTHKAGGRGRGRGRVSGGSGSRGRGRGRGRKGEGVEASLNASEAAAAEQPEASPVASALQQVTAPGKLPEAPMPASGATASTQTQQQQPEAGGQAQPMEVEVGQAHQKGAGEAAAAPQASVVQQDAASTRADDPPSPQQQPVGAPTASGAAAAGLYPQTAVFSAGHALGGGELLEPEEEDYDAE